MSNYRPLPTPIQTQIKSVIQLAQRIKAHQSLEDVYTSPIQNTMVKITGDLIIEDYDQFETFLLTFNQNPAINHHLFFEDYSTDDYEFLQQVLTDLFALIKNETIDFERDNTGLKITNIDIQQII